MKKLIMFAVLILSCATTRNGYEEMDTCPGSRMTDAQFMSGVVRCRALCSSYARDFASYEPSECKCYCQPAAGVSKPNTTQM